MSAEAAVSYDPNTQQLICQGVWDLSHLSTIQESLANLNIENTQSVTINGSQLSHLDSAGAWLLTRWLTRLNKKGVTGKLEHFSSENQKLIKLIESELQEEKPLPIPSKPHFVERVGINSINQLKKFKAYLAFEGKLTLEFLRILKSPKHIRFSSYVGVISKTGLSALPIIALLSFMIGVVLTYQMGLQLRNYGANIFIVDLLGLAVLREFGPLLTAIMVAGRTGSAYTAQLGLMKINQEIDALDTLGVTPGELLLLPRVIGLVIALPLLTIWADIFGIIGGMVMSNNMLGITWYDFLERFPRVIPLKSLLIGLGKAPVFALLISSIGCFEGMSVKNSADSVGENTTRSVVLSIFFIIVVDALFSIILSELKL